MKDSQPSKKKRKFKKHKHLASNVLQVESKPAVNHLVLTLKKYQSDFFLLLVPLSLFLVLVFLININREITYAIEQARMTPLASSTVINDYPFVQNIQMIDVSAKAAIITDADSQIVIFSKNPRLRFPMASTTKIMTALTAMEYYKKTDVLTVRSAGVEGAALGILPGESFYFEDLLYAMLLPSANDAAQAIADNYPGGSLAFVQKMNEKAASLHLSDTHFSDPTGLDDDGDFTTVIDMARLASHAIRSKDLVAVTSTGYKFISTANQTRQFELHNLNKLLGIDGVYGIKTGTTDRAGEVLVTSTNKNGHIFIIVVMNSQQRFVDTQILLNFISANVKYIAPSYPSTDLGGELQR